LYFIYEKQKLIKTMLLTTNHSSGSLWHPGCILPT